MRYFVKINSKGVPVPNSLVYSDAMPKTGRWYEIIRPCYNDQGDCIQEDKPEGYFQKVKYYYVTDEYCHPIAGSNVSAYCRPSPGRFMEYFPTCLIKPCTTSTTTTSTSTTSSTTSTTSTTTTTTLALAPPPLYQAADMTPIAMSSEEIDVTWVPAGFPDPNLAVGGYILLRADAPNLPVFTATNGHAPSCDANTTIVYDDINACKSLADATGLSSGTMYNFMLIPFTWDGVHTETYNYLTAGAPTTNEMTTTVTPCVVINPTATGITYPGTLGPNTVDATLGATITSDGGDPVVYRGTLWSLGHPVGISDNVSVEGGTTTGTFSELITGITSDGSCLLTNLTSGTKVYYRAYATNSGSIAMSPEAYFIVP